jgi:hypothetical protein
VAVFFPLAARKVGNRRSSLWSFWACSIIVYSLGKHNFHHAAGPVYSIVHHTSLNWPRPPNGGSRGRKVLFPPPYQIAEESLQSLHEGNTMRKIMGNKPQVSSAIIW